jgi:hypothetical protein
MARDRAVTEEFERRGWSLEDMGVRIEKEKSRGFDCKIR